MTYKIFRKNNLKLLESAKYNYLFNKENGMFLRWGETEKDNPSFSEFGPEIADIEISTKCSGLGKPCSFCYKSNTNNGSYMNLETFKKVFHNLPETLTQIAFGIGDIDANPDIWNIFDYCRNNEYNQVVPNITINGARLDSNTLDKLAKYCGAVAVSRYNPSHFCYNAVKELTDRGMKQVNIHMLLSRESYEDCIQVIKDAKKDPRLEYLNAIVFLSLKPQGRGRSLNPLKDITLYKQLIEFAFENEVNFGFDSCSAPMFLAAIKDRKDYDRFYELAEPCESYLFSTYINVNGKTVPCSFLENKEKEIDMTKENLKLEEWWMAPSTIKWREKLFATTKNGLVKGCRQCPVYDIY